MKTTTPCASRPSLKKLLPLAVAFATPFALAADDGYGPTSVHHAPSPYRAPADLAPGAAFIDRILPMPVPAAGLEKSWGGANVNPRIVANGLEDKTWSYWCSCNDTDDKGVTHLFATRWREKGNSGHMDWPRSEVVYATANDPAGPFTIQSVLGGGHNVTRFRAKNGTEILYVIGGGYEAQSIAGPWKKHRIDYDLREAPGVSSTNYTFTEREDGSILMVSRGGHVWISEDGLKPFKKITRETLYPPMSRCLSPRIADHFEDPCVWRDEVQYNLLVNDWYGRVAYYLRSQDGVHWIWDEGKSFDPTVPVMHTDGTSEIWHKFERPNVHRDAYGRATHLYLAAVDSPKLLDKAGDNHSSKVLVLPLTVGRRLRMISTEPVDAATETVTVKLLAEPGFSPTKDIDTATLRFGAPTATDYGRGGKLLKSEPSGDDLTLTFAAGAEAGFTRAEFAGKLFGKTKTGALLFGYVRMPGHTAATAILSGRPPKITGDKLTVTVENFGLAESKPAVVRVALTASGKTFALEGTAPAIAPYGSAQVSLALPAEFPKDAPATLETVVDATGVHPEKFGSKLSKPGR